MRKLKPNEKFIKKYKTYVLIEVACPHNQKYKTTVWRYELKDEAKVSVGHHKLNGSF